MCVCVYVCGVCGVCVCGAVTWCYFCRHLSVDFIPPGPDKTKANIVFQGTVFAPPFLPSAPSLKPVSINSL